MIFITDKDYININNKEKVKQILNQFTSDIITNPSDIFDADAALRAIGEDRIADKRLLSL